MASSNSHKELGQKVEFKSKFPDSSQDPTATMYAKYKEQGFEIYQISFDTDKHFWQTSASNLPWTCVRDGNGAASSYALLYNVRQLPTFYLINKDNEIVLRDNQITDLGKEIERLITQ